MFKESGWNWWKEDERQANFSCRKIALWRERIQHLINHPDYYFDEEEPLRAISFIEKNIKHQHDKFYGKPFLLENWQKYDVIYPLFGIKHRSDNTRLIRECYLSVSKKTGKGPLIAALSTFYLYKGGKGKKVIISATTLDQAKRMYNEYIRGYIRSNPRLSHKSVTKTMTNPPTIRSIQNDSVCQVVSGKIATVDGDFPNLVVVDELHRHRDGDLYELWRSSTASKDDALIFSLTTAGESQTSFCYQVYERGARALASGEKLIEPSFASIIYEADEEDEWDSDEAIFKANPNLGVSVSEKFIKAEIEKARNDPSQRHNFIRYFNNKWHSGGGEKYIDINIWKQASSRKLEEKVLSGGYPATLGIDLSQTTDLTCLSLLFKLEPPYYYLHNLYFQCDQGDIEKREKNDKLPYRSWAKDGTLIVNPGSVIDPLNVENKIKEYLQRYEIKRIVYDPSYCGGNTRAILTKNEDIVLPHKGGYALWNYPTRRLQEEILQKRIKNGGYFIDVFNFECAHLQYSAEGLMKVCKAYKYAKHDKVDGVDGAVMAMRGWIDIEENGSKDKTSVNTILAIGNKLKGI